MAENEMKDMYGLPVEVRSTAQLGFLVDGEEYAGSLVFRECQKPMDALDCKSAGAECCSADGTTRADG